MSDKTLLITGGTGSFGNAVLRRFLNSDTFSEIRIFSRDEKKQDDMRQYYRNDRVVSGRSSFGTFLDKLICQLNLE